MTVQISAADKRMAHKMDPERMFLLLDDLKAAANYVTGEMKLSPGGDEYVYSGTTTNVDWLRDAAQAWEDYQMEMED